MRTVPMMTVMMSSALTSPSIVSIGRAIVNVASSEIYDSRIRPKAGVCLMMRKIQSK